MSSAEMLSRLTFFFFALFLYLNTSKLIFPAVIFWPLLSSLCLQDNVWDGALRETRGQWSALLVSTCIGTDADDIGEILPSPAVDEHKLQAADDTVFQFCVIKAHSGPGALLRVIDELRHAGSTHNRAYPGDLNGNKCP